MKIGEDNLLTVAIVNESNLKNWVDEVEYFDSNKKNMLAFVGSDGTTNKT